MKEYNNKLRSSETGNGRRNSGGDYYLSSQAVSFHSVKSDFSSKYATNYKSNHAVKRQLWLRKHVKTIALSFVFMAFLLLLDSFMVSIFDSANLQSRSTGIKEENKTIEAGKEEPAVHMYDRLLDMASGALVERELKQEPSSFWKESYQQASAWKPCADRKSPVISSGKTGQNNGYIVVSANGGLNQQRVAICNAVAVASLLNATLILPNFLYSNVWKDPSQFGDIYQENHFIEVMKDDIEIAKELPTDLKSLDFEATGSLITDADLPKEAKPVDYIRIVLPRLLRNRVVHFLGYGNRLGFDPLPFELQRLRCKCNFQALKFVPKIQQIGSLLVKRIRKYDAAITSLDKQLLGNFMPGIPPKRQEFQRISPSKYLALHLRFEVDMVAYSLCDFGGGESERTELQAYRELHFPLLIERLKNSKIVSQKELRILGRCPLTPEEAGLVLAGMGFMRGTYVYLAGSHIYGGKSRMKSFTDLYPNVVTKETLLTPDELAPFRNFSSQLAALDFIACATADVFAMTDSGSQLSSLVSGFRNYYGNGRAPSLRPNKKRLAAILSENETIEWDGFEERVKKMIQESQRVSFRRYGTSVYRQPRCPQCMCKLQS